MSNASYVFYFDGTFYCHPDVMEGGVGWYFTDEGHEVHGVFATKAEAEEAYDDYSNL